MKREVVRTLTLFVLFSAVMPLAISGQAGTERVMPADFKSDGCSWFPDGNYRNCCVEHDKDYYFGGPLNERKKADNRLYDCVKAKKGKFLASAMWVGVRVGAVSFLPTPFRWGFGNKWPRKEPKKDKTKELVKPTGQ